MVQILMKTTNLISFDRWLANKIHSSLNSIVTIIESTKRSKGQGNQSDKSNQLKHDNKNHCLNASNCQSQPGRPRVDDKKLRLVGFAETVTRFQTALY